VLGAWNVSVIRTAERAAMDGLPDGALMRRAAAGLAAECLRLLRPAYGAPVAVLVGAGDNGGDALYAGARLAGRGAAVTAVLLSPDRAHPGGLAALRAAGGRVLAVPAGGAAGSPAGSSAAEDAAGSSAGARAEAIGAEAVGAEAVGAEAVRAVRGARLVLDGIVGIGGKGGLRPAAAALLAAVTGTVVAVDLPSGVDADTGAVDGEAVRADVTVTFGGTKAGLLVGAGAEHAGDLRLVEIGLTLPGPDLRALEAPDAAALLPVPGPGDDKYTRGVVGVAAGSATYPGAGVLCTGAAVRGGSGMVRYAGTAAGHVRSRWPEAVVSEGRPGDAGRVQAWVVGPGIGTDDAAAALLADVLAQDVPVLVDADGLTLVGRDPDVVRRRTAPTLLTPHDREFERIAGPVGPDRVGAARRAAADLGATVLLKGNATVVAAPDGRAYANRTGTPWLATAGSGDVLSGLGGALLAAGLDAPEAGALAAYLHGRAGVLAADGATTTAAGILDALPAALREAHRAG
jgi:ADP-dependent NAD(P)H-hydrate dehydratase / NAD(P)H-hydrate epimerase